MKTDEHILQLLKMFLIWDCDMMKVTVMIPLQFTDPVVVTHPLDPACAGCNKYVGIPLAWWLDLAIFVSAPGPAYANTRSEILHIPYLIYILSNLPDLVFFTHLLNLACAGHYEYPRISCMHI